MLTHALNYVVLLLGFVLATNFAEGIPAALNNTEDSGIISSTGVPVVYPFKFRSIYESLVSEDERAYFLLYHMALGFSAMERKFPLGFFPITRARCHKTLRVPEDLDIPDELVQKFEKFDVPESESEALYRWVSTSFKIHVVRRVKLRQNVVCFPNGFCVDLDDVGSHCCPF